MPKIHFEVTMAANSLLRCFPATSIKKRLCKDFFLGFKPNMRFSTINDTIGPLSGFRVLDLSRILAGPYCTMLLGDLGAEIIKVEAPGKGDDTRQWGPPYLGKESCYFLSINRNKKSITVNLKHPKGQDLIKKLAITSDVLVENFLPGKLDTMGLGYDQLKKIAPKLIYCSITGYGSDGPYSEKPGYDLIASAAGGLMHITGPENGDPCKVGVAITDVTTGLYAYGSIMAALLRSQKTGIGQKIECNLLSTQVASLVNIASSYLNGGVQIPRMGTAHGNIVPYQAFKTADGYIVVGVGNDQQFIDLCKKLDLKMLIDDERFNSNSSRVQHRKELLPHLDTRFLKKTTKEWVTEFEDCQFPYGPINNLPQVFAHEQVKHNKLVVEMMHATEGLIKVIGPAVKFEDGGNVCRSPPPFLGQHTTEVLREILNLSEKEVLNLKEDNVLN